MGTVISTLTNELDAAKIAHLVCGVTLSKCMDLRPLHSLLREC